MVSQAQQIVGQQKRKKEKCGKSRCRGKMKRKLSSGENNNNKTQLKCKKDVWSDKVRKNKHDGRLFVFPVTATGDRDLGM